MFVDCYGLPLSTNSPQAAARYAEGLFSVMSYDAGADVRLGAALDADSDLALAYGALAVLRWQQRREAEAREFITEAHARAPGLTDRERSHLEVIESVVTGQGRIDAEGRQAPNMEAVRLARKHLRAFPRDGLVLLLLTLETVFCGDPDERQAIVRDYALLAPEYLNDPLFDSWRAICEVELGHVAAAGRLAAASLADSPRNPIAAHAYGHVAHETGELDSGASVVGDWLAGYDRAAVYHSHIAWHYAILDLERGRLDRALATFHDAVDPGHVTPTRTTLADSVGFLWRASLEYPDAAAALPWNSTRTHAQELVRAPGSPLQSLLAGAAFIGANDAQAFEELCRSWRAPNENLTPVGHALVLPMLEGLHAFAVGAYSQVVSLLEPVVAELYRVGGSNQQREMFELTLVESRWRSSASSHSAAITRRQWKAAAASRLSRGEGAGGR